ncbi:hypothetical protein [Streptomyces sp. NPDC005004]
MSNHRPADHPVADGPDRAVRFSSGAGGGHGTLPHGVDHPVLTEVLRQLLERDRRTAGRPIAYYEDSP